MYCMYVYMYVVLCSIYVYALHMCVVCMSWVLCVLWMCIGWCMCGVCIRLSAYFSYVYCVYVWDVNVCGICVYVCVKSVCYMYVCNALMWVWRYLHLCVCVYMDAGGTCWVSPSWFLPYWLETGSSHWEITSPFFLSRLWPVSSLGLEEYYKIVAIVQNNLQIHCIKYQWHPSQN